MANYINYKANIVIGDQNYLIAQNDSGNEKENPTLNEILNHIESLKEASDKFLQNVINHNNYLLACNKPKKNDEEEDYVEDN
jgi:hypothetical protein